MITPCTYLEIQRELTLTSLQLELDQNLELEYSVVINCYKLKSSYPEINWGNIDKKWGPAIFRDTNDKYSCLLPKEEDMK